MDKPPASPRKKSSPPGEDRLRRLAGPFGQSDLNHSIKEIFQQTTAGIFNIDLDGNFIYVNPGFCTMVGRRAEELYRLNIGDITHSEDVADNMRMLRRLARDRQEMAVRNRYILPDGRFVWVRNNISPLQDKQGKVTAITAISVNIHEQEEATKALRVSEEKFRLATAAGKVGTWEWDIISDYTSWSEALHKMYGIEVGNFNGGLEAELNLVHPDDRDRIATIINKVVERGTDFDIDFRIFRSDGKIRWIRERGRVQRDADGKAFRIFGTRSDITERKLVQEQLQKSESRLRFMAESMPQKVFTATPKGTIDYLNPQWAQFSGLNIEKIKKQGWSKLIHPDDIKKSTRRWNQAIKTGQPYEAEHRLRQHDGVYRWHISRAHAMRDENGEIMRWFGSNTDIDDIRNAVRRKDELELTAATLKKQQQQLVALNQAKDEFISLASHQLRTPASGVKQLLGMMLEGYVDELTLDQRSLVERANESNERQISIINDLLRVAQVDAGKVRLNPKKVDIVNLVAHVVEDQTSTFESRHQKIRFKHANDKVLVTIDEARIRMVLENLIDNASKYTYPGKRIYVDLIANKKTVEIRIRDQGVGIRKRDMAKLFHKFSRLDNPLSIAVGGTGLGLYWANKIVELHGGSIKVESKLKEGSTFTIILPIVRE